MNAATFHKLVHIAMDSKAKPPASLFIKGVDDWHVRARVAHFLAMGDIARYDEAIELFRTVIETEIDEASSEDVEEKVFAMQRLSEIESDRQDYERALKHIGLAIELAENTDFLYKYILRGELWAARWNLMHAMSMTKEAEAEVDERLEAYKDIPIEHNSYLYYGYRFKAQLAAERGVVLVAKDYMHMALHAMEIPPDFQPALDEAFSATHENASWILNQIDHATPNPEKVNWDI
jgi:tetratricopeptide (TPR) repeat protein